MKRRGLSLRWVSNVVLGAVLVTGFECGSGAGENNTTPSITSFKASPATIGAGQKSTLTAVFSGGTGVVEPGKLSVTSGKGISVSPAATTTYRLTVTPIQGTAAEKTVAVTVVPAPSIKRFTADPSEIAKGSSSKLTAIFSGGKGVVEPGKLSVTSGKDISVSPATTTTYTLTVKPGIGNAVTKTVAVKVAPAASIKKFTADPTEVVMGSSSQLTAVFSGGKGEITPGNIAVMSGMPVTVRPSTTTTYKLTVIPAIGNAIAQTVTVTVSPVPVIASFSANPTSIAIGTGSTLTAVFSGGVGVISPGSISVRSGVGVSVRPTATTTYTLTVTPELGSPITKTVTITMTNSVMVDQTPTSVAVTDQILGMNLASWYDGVANASAINTAFGQAGIAAIRWPGGSWSDTYHWGYQPGSSTLVAPYGCSCSNNVNGPPTCQQSWVGDNGSFAQFVSAIPQAGPFDLALTANYGTDEACTGGGDPKEAAAWASAAIADGVTVSHMTVGNEEYGDWETDNHSSPHDPSTYAAAVSGTNGYYDLIKAASPKTQVGVVVDADNYFGGWDGTVLSNAKGYYDFVELHYYPEAPGSESDTYLTQQAAQGLTATINILKGELASAGNPDTPIYIGEMGSVYSEPGKQSWSITQGLYAGQTLGEMMNDGVSRATWWIGFGNCWGDVGNLSSSLYGWQTFGAYNVFSDGPGDTTDEDGSPCNYGGPIGTMSPTARAFQLFSNVAVTGESVLTAMVGGDTTDLRAYAATHSGGTALVLFNLNETASETLTVNLSRQSSSADVQQIDYDKAIYDETDPAYNNGNPVWAPPIVTDLGAHTFPMEITLTPWSMNVFIVK